MRTITRLRAADFALALRDAKVLSDDATYVMGSLRDVHHAALKALRNPPSGEAGEVRVKPLVWEREESDWWVAQPPGMIGGGGYEVRLTSAGRVRARCGTEDWFYFDGTADQAKAAFQSDYETRIRSALLPTIKEPTDGK